MGTFTLVLNQYSKKIGGIPNISVNYIQLCCFTYFPIYSPSPSLAQDMTNEDEFVFLFGYYRERTESGGSKILNETVKKCRLSLKFTWFCLESHKREVPLLSHRHEGPQLFGLLTQ